MSTNPRVPAHIGKRATRGARRQRHRKQKVTNAQKAQKIAQKNTEWSDEESSSESDEWYSGDEHDQRAYQKGGYLKVIPGTCLNERYVVQQRLGWGHFAMVFLAVDKKAKKAERKYVALKIQKSSADYQEAAEEEIPFLEKVLEEAEKTYDTLGRPNVARMFDHFSVYGDHGKHYVMVFELLGMCPAELLKDFEEGLPIAMVKRMMRDLLVGLDFLHEKAQVMHMDIKPENVLFARTEKEKVSEEEIKLRKAHYAQKADKKAQKDAIKKLQKQRDKLSKNQKKRLKEKVKKLDKKIQAHEKLDDLPCNTKASEDFVNAYCESLLPNHTEEPPRAVLCDLGTACWTYKVNNFDVGTRYGRPPEMLVGLRYDPPADIWAMACLCVELLSGDPLFDPESEDEDGNPLDDDEEHLRVILEACGPKYPKYINGASGAREFMNGKGEMKSGSVEVVGLPTLLGERIGLNEEQVGDMMNFLDPMLRLDPNRRASAKKQLDHPWLEITSEDLQETAEWLDEHIGESDSDSDYTDGSSSSNSEDADSDAEVEKAELHERREDSDEEFGKDDTLMSPSDQEREEAEINRLLEEQRAAETKES